MDLRFALLASVIYNTAGKTTKGTKTIQHYVDQLDPEKRLELIPLPNKQNRKTTAKIEKDIRNIRSVLLRASRQGG